MIASADLAKENYSSGDLAKLLGLTSRIIWNYQREGILKGWYTSGKFYGLRSVKKRAARTVLDEVSSGE